MRRALAADGPPRYQRALKGSAVDAVEPQIWALLQEFPQMPATVIAERIGWTRGMTVLKERVRELQPAVHAAGSGGARDVCAGRGGPPGGSGGQGPGGAANGYLGAEPGKRPAQVVAAQRDGV